MWSLSRSVWECQEQLLKTANAVRVVDVPEQLGRVLRDYTANRTGLLFATRDGKPLSQRNVLRSLHAAGAGALGVAQQCAELIELGAI